MIHYIRGDNAERFWPKVAKGDGCWEWLAGGNKKGYGFFWCSRRKRMVQAHIIGYELVVGPVPEDAELDHLCRNKRCVNPAHMEPVDHRANILRGESPYAQKARQTHCIHGHPFDAENTIYRRSKTGTTLRQCRACQREAGRRWRHRRVA